MIKIDYVGLARRNGNNLEPCRCSGIMDSAGCIFYNLDKRNIKYIFFKLRPYNAVGDIADCVASDTYKFGEYTQNGRPFNASKLSDAEAQGILTPMTCPEVILKCTGPITMNEGKQTLSSDVWFIHDDRIGEVRILSAYIIYMDDSREYITYPDEKDGFRKPKTEFDTAEYGEGVKIRNGSLEKYTGTAEELTLPKAVQWIDPNAFENCTTLKKIILHDGFTSIDERAFRGCRSLTEIAIPDTVTSIGSGAFADCISLKSIKLPSGLCRIEMGAFTGCSSLSEITIPDGVESIKEFTFMECKSLERVVMPREMYEIGKSAFASCTSLASIRFPCTNFHIGNAAFMECTALKELTIPSQAIVEKLAFADCTGLEKLALSEGIQRVEEGAFSNCSALTEVTIPSSLKYLHNSLFMGCTSLKKAKLCEGVQQIWDGVFNDCESLNEIYLPDTLEAIGSVAFGGCKSLKEIYVPQNVVSLSDTAFEPRLKCAILSYPNTRAQQVAQTMHLPFISTERPSATRKKKKKAVAIALFIFGGPFGLHKFYEGKIGMGFLYWFTFGLFFAGLGYDILNYASKPSIAVFIGKLVYGSKLSLNAFVSLILA